MGKGLGFFRKMCLILGTVLMFFVISVTAFAEETNDSIHIYSLTDVYVDSDGNEMTYVVDDDGNATITNIIVSGSNLSIPSVIGEYTVKSVANEQKCAVDNPGTKITQLTIDCEIIGCNAFKGTAIGTLIIGENVSYFEQTMTASGGDPICGQFAEAKIEKVFYRAISLRTAMAEFTYSKKYVGPFYEASVGELEIADTVTAIPEALMRQAMLKQERLEINVKTIGAYAFAGNDIEIGRLVIGEGVEVFEESYYSTSVYHYWNQFMDCRISCLEYSATQAETVHNVAAMDAATTIIYGVFHNASVSEMSVTDNVNIIPDYLLKDANATITELMLDVNEIGAMSFCSSSITVERLVIGENVSLFRKSDHSNSAYDYWETFGNITVNELIYKATDAASENALVNVICPYGAFYSASVGSLTITDNVESIPAYLFAGAVFSAESLELHAKRIGAGAFAGNTITIDRLILGKEIESFECTTDGGLRYYKQFYKAIIGMLDYEAINAATGTSCYEGVFEGAEINVLAFGDEVEVIPNYLFYHSYMALDSLMVNVPVIGYSSFYSGNISIGELTIGKDVITFSVSSDGSNRAFDYCSIGKLTFMAREAQLEELKGNYYGPFAEYCKIDEVVFDETVTVIPYGCFRDAVLELDTVTIENAAIGYGAFFSSNIHINQLNIGKNVTAVGIVSNQMKCFYGVKIDELNYNSNAALVSWVTGTGAGLGMFSYAQIGKLQIGNDVEVIPECWFYNASIRQDELTVSCNWGTYAFCSSGIEIGRLILCGDIDNFCYRSYKNYGFALGTYETVIYDIPSAKYEPDTISTNGIFEANNISNFIVTERVSYIDNKIFKNLNCTNCYVYAVFAEDGYSTQKFTVSEFPVCENLSIHYNSDFKNLFEIRAANKEWLCEAYFDKSYGDKYYNEETGTYNVKLYQLCSVCGYEEESVCELDSSYDLLLSIPVDIFLVYDSESRCYSGSSGVYAYGRLGNAYEGIHISTDKDSNTYGMTDFGGQILDFSDYVNVFYETDGEINEKASFDRSLIEWNKDVLDGADDRQLYTSEMNVSVNGIAFTYGGAGEYKIQIPLKVEFY